MQLSNVDYRDIQGLVRFGHSPLKEASFLLLRVTNADAARRWLAKAPVTTAVKTRGGDGVSAGRALQVAFTFDGLAELGVAKSILEAFPYEFRLGLAGEESRSRRLGDVGANDPKNWQWGGPGRLPHVAVLLYAADKQLASWQSAIKAELAASGFSELACLDTSALDNVEFVRLRRRNEPARAGLGTEKADAAARHARIHQRRSARRISARLPQ